MKRSLCAGALFVAACTGTASDTDSRVDKADHYGSGTDAGADGTEENEVVPATPFCGETFTTLDPRIVSTRSFSAGSELSFLEERQLYQGFNGEEAGVADAAELLEQFFPDESVDVHEMRDLDGQFGGFHPLTVYVFSAGGNTVGFIYESGSLREVASVQDGLVECAAPTQEFLSDDQRNLVANILGDDCVSQACDGDFDWRVSGARCDALTSTCTIELATRPHQFVGTLSEAEVVGELGSQLDGEDGHGPFSASIEGMMSSEDGVEALVWCTLSGYSQAADVIADSGDALTKQFEKHFLDCSLAGAQALVKSTF